MNIFKILANGDGTINEANVSAFLGYLLDPKGDHTLGFEFLKGFLKSLPGLEDDKFYLEKYEYEVFYEQAFQEEGAKKNIVDIVVVCYSVDRGEKTESLVKAFLENPKVVNKIFLIENKIRTASLTTGQLRGQLEATKAELGDDLDAEIYSIYITPDDEKFRSEFLSSKIPESSHVFWETKQRDDVSIRNILCDISSRNALGEIEPLDEYTLHTINAFGQFIGNGFRSERQESKERTRRNDGNYTKDFRKINEESQIEEKLISLKERLVSSGSLPRGMSIGDPDLSDPRQPHIPLIFENIKINVSAGFKTRDRINLAFSVNRDDVESSRNSLNQLAKCLELTIKKPDDRKGAYCRSESMINAIPLKDYVAIESAIIVAGRHIFDNLKSRV